LQGDDFAGAILIWEYHADAELAQAGVPVLRSCSQRRPTMRENFRIKLFATIIYRKPALLVCVSCCAVIKKFLVFDVIRFFFSRRVGAPTTPCR